MPWGTIEKLEQRHDISRGSHSKDKKETEEPLRRPLHELKWGRLGRQQVAFVKHGSDRSLSSAGLRVYHTYPLQKQAKVFLIAPRVKSNSGPSPKFDPIMQCQGLMSRHPLFPLPGMLFSPLSFQLFSEALLYELPLEAGLDAPSSFLPKRLNHLVFRHTYPLLDILHDRSSSFCPAIIHHQALHPVSVLPSCFYLEPFLQSLPSSVHLICDEFSSIVNRISFLGNFSSKVDCLTLFGHHFARMSRVSIDIPFETFVSVFTCHTASCRMSSDSEVSNKCFPHSNFLSAFLGVCMPFQ